MKNKLLVVLALGLIVGQVQSAQPPKNPAKPFVVPPMPIPSTVEHDGKIFDMAALSNGMRQQYQQIMRGADAGVKAQKLERFFADVQAVNPAAVIAPEAQQQKESQKLERDRSWAQRFVQPDQEEETRRFIEAERAAEEGLRQQELFDGYYAEALGLGMSDDQAMVYALHKVTNGGASEQGGVETDQVRAPMLPVMIGPDGIPHAVGGQAAAMAQVDQERVCRLHPGGACGCFVEPEVEECAVCRDQLLTDELTTTTPCHHTFHTGCLNSAVAVSPWCPTCRTVLRQRPVAALSQEDIDMAADIAAAEELSRNQPLPTPSPEPRDEREDASLALAQELAAQFEREYLEEQQQPVRNQYRFEQPAAVAVDSDDENLQNALALSRQPLPEMNDDAFARVLQEEEIRLAHELKQRIVNMREEMAAREQARKEEVLRLFVHYFEGFVIRRYDLEKNPQSSKNINKKLDAIMKKYAFSRDELLRFIGTGEAARQVLEDFKQTNPELFTWKTKKINDMVDFLDKLSRDDAQN